MTRTLDDSNTRSCIDSNYQILLKYFSFATQTITSYKNYAIIQRNLIFKSENKVIIPLQNFIIFIKTLL